MYVYTQYPFCKEQWTFDHWLSGYHSVLQYIKLVSKVLSRIYLKQILWWTEKIHILSFALCVDIPASKSKLYFYLSFNKTTSQSGWWQLNCKMQCWWVGGFPFLAGSYNNGRGVWQLSPFLLTVSVIISEHAPDAKCRCRLLTPKGVFIFAAISTKVQVFLLPPTH